MQQRIAHATNAILANEYLRRTLAPITTEARLHEVYAREVAGQPGPAEARARIIVTYTQQGALDALAMLRIGDDFADVARKVSKDSSAPAGGDLGFVRQDAVAPEIGAVLFALEPGQTSNFPNHAAGAWLIVKCEARREQPPPLEAVKAQLTQQLIRAGTAAVVEKSMTGLPRRDFSMMGRDVAAPK